MSQVKVFDVSRSQWKTTNSQDGKVIVTCRITPVQAEILLRNNHNRNLRPAMVSKLKRDILAGNFTHSNDLICFDGNTALLNGQHRLHAIKDAGVPVDVAIAFGYTRDEQQRMDQGRGRSLHDVLTLNGHSDINTRTSRIARYTRSQTCGVRATREEEVAFALKYKEQLTFTDKLLTPSDEVEDDSTGMRIGNDIGSAFARAIIYYWNAPNKLDEVKRLANALVYTEAQAELQKTKGKHGKDLVQAATFKLLLRALNKRSGEVRGGQDQNGRDRMYKIVEKALSIFVNARDSDTVPCVLRTEEEELFKLEEDYRTI